MCVLEPRLPNTDERDFFRSIGWGNIKFDTTKWEVFYNLIQKRMFSKSGFILRHRQKTIVNPVTGSE